MTIADVYILDAIRTYTTVARAEIATMQNFINNHIDPKANICITCPAQIRFHHNRIITWGDQNAEMIEGIRNQNK